MFSLPLHTTFPGSYKGGVATSRESTVTPILHKSLHGNANWPASWGGKKPGLYPHVPTSVVVVMVTCSTVVCEGKVV